MTSRTVQFGDPLFVFSPKNEVYDNSEETKCPIKSCKLKVADCSADYVDPNLTISTTGNFDISLKTTQEALGQIINFCVECSSDPANGLQIIQVPNITVQ